MQNEFKIYVIILSVTIFEFIEMQNLYSGKNRTKLVTYNIILE